MDRDEMFILISPRGSQPFVINDTCLCRNVCVCVSINRKVIVLEELFFPAVSSFPIIIIYYF